MLFWRRFMAEVKLTVKTNFADAEKDLKSLGDQ